jgi:aminoglycoside phosphotransferase (APT) family kinase protein
VTAGVPMHDDELVTDAGLVRRLLAEQFPAWASLPVIRIEGDATVNAIYRVGDGLAARLPLRGDAGTDVTARLAREAAALDELADAIPFPAPRHVAIGRPGAGYPLPWSVQTWLPGEVATAGGLAGSTAFADDLATLIRALRAAPTRGRTFAGSGRGGDLTDHDAWMATCFAESEALLDVPALRVRWAALRTLPRGGPDVMAHGDLHPANLLVRGDRLVGVLDGGGFGPADPALDLVAAWHLLDAPARLRLREALGSDELEWRRGAAWAFEQAMGLVWYYRGSNPGMSALGRSTLARIMGDPGIAAVRS